jgi:excisionase family DNA binding protein
MDLLTVREAAERLRVSKALLYGLIKSGKLPFVSVGNAKGYRLLGSDIEEFIQSNRKQFQESERPKPRRRFKHLKL